MLLADAIEAWGRAHREVLPRAELEELGTVWRTIKTSPQATLDFHTMSKDDGRQVMALFDAAQRADVSRTLNRVRKWALVQPVGAPAQPPVQPVRSNLPGAETVIMGRPTDPAASARTAPSLIGAGPAGPRSEVAQAGPPGDPLSRGPVEGWQPPPGTPSGSGTPDPKVIGIIVGIVVFVLLIWFLFLRGDDDSVLPVDAGAAAGAAAIDSGTGQDTTTSDPSGTDSVLPSFDGGDSGDFCTVARQIDESDPFSDEAFLNFGPQTFAEPISLFEGLSAIAPGEVKGDIEVLLAQFRQMDAWAAQYDYNVADPALAEAFSTLDTGAVDAAGDRLSAYLLEVCGINTGSDSTGDGPTDTGVDTSGSIDAIDLTDEQVRLLNEAFLAQFSLTPELATCLGEQLGDLTAAATDPALLNQAVCGTTLLNVISGLSG